MSDGASSGMGKTLTAWQLKFDALSLRERMLLAAAPLVVTFFVVDALLLSAWSRQNSGLKASLPEQRAEAARVSAQVKALQAQLADNPDAQAKARIGEIERKIAAIDTGLQSSAKQLVPPEHMATLLEELLKRNRRLQLVKMMTLPPVGLLGRNPAGDAPNATGQQPAATPQGDSPNIYKHGVELTLRGSYFDMLDYLAQIEALPWQMYWGQLKLDARDYHRPELKLTLYTLSLDKVWLTI